MPAINQSKDNRIGSGSANYSQVQKGDSQSVGYGYERSYMEANRRAEKTANDFNKLIESVGKFATVASKLSIEDRKYRINEVILKHNSNMQSLTEDISKIGEHDNIKVEDYDMMKAKVQSQIDETIKHQVLQSGGDSLLASEAIDKIKGSSTTLLKTIESEKQKTIVKRLLPELSEKIDDKNNKLETILGSESFKFLKDSGSITVKDVTNAYAQRRIAELATIDPEAMKMKGEMYPDAGMLKEHFSEFVSQIKPDGTVVFREDASMTPLMQKQISESINSFGNRFKNKYEMEITEEDQTKLDNIVVATKYDNIYGRSKEELLLVANGIENQSKRLQAISSINRSFNDPEHMRKAEDYYKATQDASHVVTTGVDVSEANKKITYDAINTLVNGGDEVKMKSAFDNISGLVRSNRSKEIFNILEMSIETSTSKTGAIKNLKNVFAIPAVREQYMNSIGNKGKKNAMAVLFAISDSGIDKKMSDELVNLVWNNKLSEEYEKNNGQYGTSSVKLDQPIGYYIEEYADDFVFDADKREMVKEIAIIEKYAGMEEGTLLKGYASFNRKGYEKLDDNMFAPKTLIDSMPKSKFGTHSEVILEALDRSGMPKDDIEYIKNNSVKFTDVGDGLYIIRGRGGIEIGSIRAKPENVNGATFIKSISVNGGDKIPLKMNSRSMFQKILGEG